MALPSVLLQRFLRGEQIDAKSLNDHSARMKKSLFLFKLLLFNLRGYNSHPVGNNGQNLKLFPQPLSQSAQ
jgi:hypothetical protein